MPGTSTLGNFEVIRELGDGYSGSVLLARDPSSRELVALKAPFPEKLAKSPKIAKLMAHEYSVLKNLKHPRIVRALGYWESVRYVRGPGPKEGDVPVIELELAPNGELCSLICEKGRLSENAARFYFRQLAETIDFIHSKGLAHRDLKPENLLFDEDFNLKLVDFAFAVPLDGPETALVGTPGYLAPEMHPKKGYIPAKVDLFATGVILFIMMRGMPPFNDTVPSDPHYSVFSRAPDMFWKYHKAKDPLSPCPDDFVDLVNRLLDPEPRNRPSSHQILKHPFLLRPVDEVMAKEQTRKLKLSK